MSNDAAKKTARPILTVTPSTSDFGDDPGEQYGYCCCTVNSCSLLKSNILILSIVGLFVA